jgi:translation initiation factor 5A
MSLMTDSGDTKDDVKVPDNEVGEKINQMFVTEEKECSKLRHCPNMLRNYTLTLSSDIVVLTAMGEEAAMECKEAPKSG